LIIHDTAGVAVSELNFVGSGPDTNQGDGIRAENDLPGDVTLDYLAIDHVDVSHYGDDGVLIRGVNGLSGFRDVRVIHSKLHDNVFLGLEIVTSTPAPDQHAIHNIYVGYVEAYGNTGSATEGGGYGIGGGGVDGGEVELSVVHDNGSDGEAGAGIWVYYSDDVVVQSNESYRNRTNGDIDGDGFALDFGSTNCVLQYNYSHDNFGAGYLLLSNWNEESLRSSGDVVRFNISENDARKDPYDQYAGIAVIGGEFDNWEIYNNTVYVGGDSDPGRPAMLVNAVDKGSDVHIHDNIFQTTDGHPQVIVWGQNSLNTDVTFQGNDYF